MFTIARESRKYLYCYCPNKIHEIEHPNPYDRRPSLVVTKTGPYAGYYHCFSCGKSGECKNLNFNKTEEAKEDIDWDQIQEVLTVQARSRNFSTQLRRFGVGITQSGWMTFPVYNQFERVVGIQKHKKGKKIYYEGSNEGLFIPNLRWNKCKKLFISEGVKDGVSLLKLKLFTLARPNCEPNVDLVTGWIEYRDLEDIPKVIVADNDAPGIDGAKELWRNMNNSIIKIPPKKGDDIRDMLKRNCPGKIRRWLNHVE